MKLLAEKFIGNAIAKEGLFLGAITHATIADSSKQFGPGMKLVDKPNQPKYLATPQVLVRVQTEEGSAIGTMNLAGYAKFDALSNDERKKHKDVNGYAVDKAGIRMPSEIATKQALAIFGRLVNSAGLEDVDLGDENDETIQDVVDNHEGETVNALVGKEIAFRTVAYEGADGATRYQINTGRIYDLEYGKGLITEETTEADSF